VVQGMPLILVLYAHDLFLIGNEPLMIKVSVEKFRALALFNISSLVIACELFLFL